MDHPCHKCGHNIEDGKPFCSQCGAPQIRVAMPEVATDITSVNNGVAPVLDREMVANFSTIPIAALPGSGAYPMQPCALAAAVAFGLTLLGLNPFVAALVTGLLAVAFFRRRRPGIVIRSGAGARLGVLSGSVLFGMLAILKTVAVVVLHKGEEIRSQMLDTAQQAAARHPGPEAQQFLDFVKTPGGFAFMMVGSVIVGLIAFVILSSSGGALAAAFLGRRDRP
jgi:hypothetical protein